MKKYFQAVIIFILFMTLIPMIAILSGEKPQKIGSTVLKSTLPEIKTVKILDTQGGNIIELPIREYLIGAVAAQMPYEYEEEALKCQAVLAHTYIISRRIAEQESPTKELLGADISLDKKLYQPYFSDKDIESFYGEKAAEAKKKIAKCVDDVKDIIAVYNSKPIVSAFHGISSGFTESAENAWGIDIPYLKSVESEFDPSSKDYAKKYIITDDELKQKLLDAYPELEFKGDPETWLDISETSRGGTVLGIGLGDKKKVISGYDFMAIFDLRSPHFKFTYENGSFIFTVCGCGHLVGLSQYGANELAKNGKSCEQIMAFYFKGIGFEKINN
ncbi:MAG: stage II sporulation protein D [Ruminococcus sp.]|nr:stage II sporulation protein D [Ruminococcus sp.]